MSATDPPVPLAETSPAVERVANHLLRNPFDLLDASRLMRRLRASAADVQSAFTRVEHLRREAGQRGPAPAHADSEAVGEILSHLRHHPYAILDPRQLLRRFGASGPELRRALDRFSELVVEGEDQ